MAALKLEASNPEMTVPPMATSGGLAPKMLLLVLLEDVSTRFGAEFSADNEGDVLKIAEVEDPN